ncbi:polyprenyl synthetase family protein [Kushneria aurantia]|uniref:Polyprenyl synthetase family protein n=1 Tax=Kushneria aurantia TaxID=504092 RepID=A0ABV6G5L6_9GAMM|nr:polyprenyl synthetase family protein [Kushneria aurantia]
MTGSTFVTLERQPGQAIDDSRLQRELHDTISGVLHDSAHHGIVRDAVDHHLAAAGGYLRARLGYRAAVALGIDHRDALHCACISELLHNASLIHDDVLDHDSQRRGQPSVWRVWNESVAICLGDLFISAAYGVIARLESHAARLPALLLQVHHQVHSTINGQADSFGLALQGEADFDQYCRAACGKSGPLFALALEAPLTLTGHDDETLKNARGAALAFATVYQLVDDIEDYEDDMRCEGPGICNMLHALIERGDAAPELSARDYGRLRLAETRHTAERLPARCGAALIGEANRLEARLVAVSGGEQ